MKENIAGRLAGAFLQSKLTPLLMAATLAVGLWTVVNMASEEEPQIIVPLADLYLPLPGATPQEVENRVLIPLESVLSGIEGVEYVYSHAQPGFGLVSGYSTSVLASRRPVLSTATALVPLVPTSMPSTMLMAVSLASRSPVSTPRYYRKSRA